MNCHNCQTELHEDEVIWATEDGELNTDSGNPYCVKCCPEIKERCTSCGKAKDDVEVRYSFGIYAGRLCVDCCGKYRDNCGIDQPQGRAEDTDEFVYGGYEAVYGDE